MVAYSIRALHAEAMADLLARRRARCCALAKAFLLALLIAALAS